MKREAAALGLFGATALVIGNMIGSGTYLLPASLAPFGIASLYGWAACFVGAIALAVMFMQLSRATPDAGGPYAYARNAFGPWVGFLVGWCYWFSIVSGNAAIAVAFASNFGALAPDFVSTPLRAAATSIAALWACTAINLVGLRATSGLQNATTILKCLPLIAIAIATPLLLPAAARTQPVMPADLGVAGATLGAAAITVWAFLGIESATVPADRVRDPSRTIPRATLAGVLIAGVVMVASCTAVLFVVPSAQLAQATAPFADAATIVFGAPFAIVFAAAAAIACFGALNGWVLMQGELPIAAARDGVFPPSLAHRDARGTPVRALLVGSTIASLLIASNYGGSLVRVFTISVLISTGATLVPYVACAAAALRGARTWRSMVAPALAGLFSLWALAGTGREPLAWCAALLLAGVVAYPFVRRAART